MKRVILLSCFVLGVGVLVACGGNRGDTLQGAANLAVPTALAQDDGGAKGCSIIGSWMTKVTPKFEPPDVNIPWLATLNGESSHSGTIVTTVPLWPVPLTEGVKVTDLRGNWERTGGNTFKFTQIGWGINGNGVGVVVFRNAGITTLLDDCSLMKVESTMEALLPDLMTPVPGPDSTTLVPTMFARRIVIRAPALPLQ